MNSSPRRVATAAALFAALFIQNTQAQWKTFEFDTNDQTPILLDGVFTGNTPYLRANGYDSGVPLSFAGWTVTFQYSYGQYDTNGMAIIPTSSVSSNQLRWIGATNTFFAPYDKYYFSVVGISTTGEVKTFCTGRMIQRYDPAADTNVTYMIGQVNIDWWTNNVGAQVASNTARIEVLETGKVSQADYNTFTNANRVELDAHFTSNTVSFAGVETQKLDVSAFTTYTNAALTGLTPAWSNVTAKPTIMGTPSNTATVTWEPIATNDEAVTYQATAVITGKLDTSVFDTYTQDVNTAVSPAWTNITGKPIISGAPSNSTTITWTAAGSTNSTTNYQGNVVMTTLFAGVGTTGFVKSAISDAGKYLRADGTFNTPPATSSLAFADITGLPNSNSNLSNSLATASTASHAGHSNLGWVNSGHTGVVSSIAGFSALGAATDYDPTAFASAFTALTNVTVVDGTNNSVVVSINTAAITINTNYATGESVSGDVESWHTYPAVSTVQWDVVTSSYDSAVTNWSSNVFLNPAFVSLGYGGASITNIFDGDITTTSMVIGEEPTSMLWNYSGTITGTQYRVYKYMEDVFQYTLDAWDLYGSSNGVDYTLIDSQTNMFADIEDGGWTGTIAQVAYRYFMLTNCYNSTGTFVGSAEIQMDYQYVTYSNLTYSTNSAYVSYDGTNLTFSDSQTTNTLSELASGGTTGTVTSVSGDNLWTTNSGTATDPVISMTADGSNSLAAATNLGTMASASTGDYWRVGEVVTNAAATNSLGSVLFNGNSATSGIFTATLLDAIYGGAARFTMGSYAALMASSNDTMYSWPPAAGRFTSASNEVFLGTDDYAIDARGNVLIASNLTVNGTLNGTAATTVVANAASGKTAYDWGDHGTNGYLTAESDPVWVLASNTVTAGAAAGATALQDGGTLTTGLFYSAALSGPSGLQVPTADWVREFMEQGADMWPTTNQVTTAILPTGTVYYASDETLATATEFSLTVTGVNHYVMSILDTNLIMAGETLSGPANVEIWIQSASGAQTALSVKPELYLIATQDVETITVPTIGDWDAAAQVITLGTTTNRYLWTVSWPDHVVASNSYRIARLKVTAKGNNTSAMKIAAGGIYTSHLNMQTSTDSSIGTRGATNIVAGATNSYDPVTRTMTWNTNDAASGSSAFVPLATTNLNMAGFAVSNSQGQVINPVYVLTSAATVTVSEVNGNCQVLTVAHPSCTIELPSISSNNVGTLFFGINAGTNQIVWSNANSQVTWATSPTIPTNGTAATMLTILRNWLVTNNVWIGRQ